MVILTDATCWFYSIRILFGALFIIFAIKFWRREKTIPTLIAYLIFMVFVQWGTDIFHLNTRSLSLLKDPMYQVIKHSFWWWGRLIPEGIILILATRHMMTLALSPEKYKEV